MLLSIILNELKDPQNPCKTKGMLWLLASVAMLSWGYSIFKKMILDGMEFVMADPM